MKPKWLFDLLYIILRGVGLCFFVLVALGLLGVAFIRFLGAIIDRHFLDPQAGLLDLGAGALIGMAAYAISRTSDTRPSKIEPD